MECVGLFDAKTRLSELVARAESGDEVVITRHNRPVAKLVPIAPREELRARHGSLTTAEIVSWVREGRDERDEQIWRNATGSRGGK